MKIRVASVMVQDQSKALRFYTEVLGFVKKTEVPLGEHSWLTVVSRDEPDGVELLLEPTGFPPAVEYQRALHDSGIPLMAFYVEDLDTEVDRLKKHGVSFSMQPTIYGPAKLAVLDDTCGNHIQLVEVL